MLFGGSKDVAFNKEISDLLGQVRVARTNYNSGRTGGRQVSGEDIAILTAAELRQLKERHVLLLAENGAPIIARLHRCIDGKAGARLLVGQDELRCRVTTDRAHQVSADARAAAALVAARRAGLLVEHGTENP